MRRLMKIFCIFGSVLFIFKIAQIAVDFLYENYGKRYITADSVE